jgi:hypothetical protein
VIIGGLVTASTHDRIQFHYKKPGEVSPETLDRIRRLIEKGAAVGLAHVTENLQNAFLLGYATNPEGRVTGTVILKHPKEAYRKKIEAATGLDLTGYLERGYTSVEPEYGHREIADRLIKGLIERSRGQKIYVTIRMDNVPALKLTYKNGMTFAAEFLNERTGHRIGLFTNQ